MDKNNIIGFVLIGLMLALYTYINTPSAEQVEIQQRLQDSIALVEQDLIKKQNDATTDALPTTPNQPALPDSIQDVQLLATYGAFASSAQGTDSEVVLENELSKVTFSTKGGRVVKAELKNYKKIWDHEAEAEINTSVFLLEDERNKFSFALPVVGAGKEIINTEDLYFTETKTANSISFKASAGPGKYIEQVYTMKPGKYDLDYSVKMVGLEGIVKSDNNEIELQWVNYLDKIEKNYTYETTLSSIYYREGDDSPTYCSCTGDDDVETEEQPIQWVSHSNQFFNSTLIAKGESFTNGEMKVKLYDAAENTDLKKLSTNLSLPFKQFSNGSFDMTFLIGPKDYDVLQSYDQELEYTIAFGWSFFGTINRYFIRPLFNFLQGIVGSYGLSILLLTVFVRLLLFPLTYKMILSQSKMAALKPDIAKIKEKHGDDQQKVSMETMKMYQESGASPLGGCLPMVVQLPIWFALYRFFPAAIEFRQESFLWAMDLSSYDEFIQLGFDIPAYGSHVSLFTLLWAITTVIYSWYNGRHMDYSANPAMQYMQYFMPIMFLFFFNKFASGLTCYLFLSNVVNIAQMYITKNFIIDHDKIKEELALNRKKPQKKGKFRSKLEDAMKEAQKQQEAKNNKKKK